MVKSFVEVILLADCNFSCDYCISGSNLFPFQPGFSNYTSIDKNRVIRSGSDRLPLITRIDEYATTDEIQSLWNNGTAFHGNILNFERLVTLGRTSLKDWTFVISGGEPLLYPNIEYWLSKLMETNNVVLLTNASKINRISNIIGHERLYIRVGYHPEQRTVDEFEDAVAHISSKTDNYIVNYVFHPRHLIKKQYKKYIDLLMSRGFRYEVTPFDGDYNGVSYNTRNIHPEILPFISKKYVTRVDADPADWAGESMLYISGNGTITGCARGVTGNGHIVEGVHASVVPHVKGECVNEKTGCNCTSVRLYGMGMLDQREL